MHFTLNAETPLTDEILLKMLNKSKADVARLEKLENYYAGKHDILNRTVSDPTKPNNKVVAPYAQYITDTLAGYFAGEPIAYSSSDEEAVDELNMVLTYNDAAAEDMSIARDASIYGVAYELMYVDADNATRFTKVNPKEIIIVYEDTIEQNILYAIRKIPFYDIVTEQHGYRVEVYNSQSIRYYTADAALSSLKFNDEVQHFFNDVPVVEYKNNEILMGDFESIIPLINAYDNLLSDSLNDYEYFVDAYLTLTGVTATADDIRSMKENRVLLLDEDSKAQWLVKSGNDNQTENIKNRIQNDIHKFAKVPDLSDESFAANASGIAIKFKLYGTETLVSNKERFFQMGLQRRIELIFNIINLKGAAFDWRSIEVNFTRNVPTNGSEIADIVQKLSGIVSTETLLAQIPFVHDIGAEMDRLEKQKEDNPFYDLDLELGTNENETGDK